MFVNNIYQITPPPPLEPTNSPNFKQLSPKNHLSNNELAFSVAEEHLGISRPLNPKEMKKPDKLTLLSYLSLFYELFLDAEPVSAPCEEEAMAEEVAKTPTRGSNGVPATQAAVTVVSPASTPSAEEGGASLEASPEKEVASGKKKRKRSLFRRSSKKKLGVSPSSAER